MKKPLTALALGALKPKATPYYVADAKQDGLRVRVAVNGSMTWNVTYRIKGGAVRSTSLGKADPAGTDGADLTTARDRAAAILKAAREGRDLLGEEVAKKEAARELLTVEGLIALYAKSLATPNRRGGPLRTAPEIERRLLRALATQLSSPIDDLNRGRLSRLLDEVAERHPREAEKRRQVIHAMMRWALGKGYATENVLAGTPTYGAGAPRDRVLTADEIRVFWNWLDGGAGDMPSDPITVLRLQLLLGARVGEIAGMEAHEVAEQEGALVWTLPASRSKNKRERVTPIVGQASAIIQSALGKRSKGPLFRTLDGERALTSTDIGQALLNRPRPTAHFTTHDLRRTVVSGMDELGIALDTIAAVVGHQRGTAATQVLVRHYSRPKLDSRKEAALLAWDNHVTAVISGQAIPDNVVRMLG